MKRSGLVPSIAYDPPIKKPTPNGNKGLQCVFINYVCDNIPCSTIYTHTSIFKYAVISFGSGFLSIDGLLYVCLPVDQSVLLSLLQF